jgi:hypothetical protein
MGGLSKDNIVRMAIDAIGGDMNGQDVQHLTWRLEHFKDDSYKFGSDALLKFVALVAAAEREACAKVLDEMAAKDKLTNYYVVGALAIRERGAP